MAPCGIFNHRAGDPKDLLKAEHRAPDNQEEPVVHNGNNDDESILQARESPAQSTQVPVARMPGAVLPKKQAASKSTNSQGPQSPDDFEKPSDPETASLWARQLLEKMDQTRGPAANDQQISQTHVSPRAT